MAKPVLALCLTFLSGRVWNQPAETRLKMADQTRHFCRKYPPDYSNSSPAPITTPVTSSMTTQ